MTPPFLESKHHVQENIPFSCPLSTWQLPKAASNCKILNLTLKLQSEFYENAE